jgi:hypothetical protein
VDQQAIEALLCQPAVTQQPLLQELTPLLPPPPSGLINPHLHFTLLLRLPANARLLPLQSALLGILQVFLIPVIMLHATARSVVLILLHNLDLEEVVKNLEGVYASRVKTRQDT